MNAIFIKYPEEKQNVHLDKLADYLFKDPDNPFTKNSHPGMPYEKVIDMLTKTLGKAKD